MKNLIEQYEKDLERLNENMEELEEKEKKVYETEDIELIIDFINIKNLTEDCIVELLFEIDRLENKKNEKLDN